MRIHPDDEVVVLDALTYAGHRESLAQAELSHRLEFVHGSILEPHVVARTLRGADLVIHLAAETHNDRAIKAPMPFVDTNIVGTATLLEACRQLDVPRFHHVSTDEVFGSLDLNTPEKFTEESPYRPRGPYAASKAAADHLVRSWYETYGLRVTITNCSNNFGPYQHPEKLIPLSITRLIGGGTVPVYGDGLNVRDWIFVEDHCAALDLVAHEGRAGTTYLISAGVELSNLEVVRRIIHRFGRGDEAIEYVRDRPGHDRRYALDARRISEELGWHPVVDFDQALAETVEWYRHNEQWWKPLAPSSGRVTP